MLEKMAALLKGHVHRLTLLCKEPGEPGKTPLSMQMLHPLDHYLQMIYVATRGKNEPIAFTYEGFNRVCLNEMISNRLITAKFYPFLG
jgi:hypothetical protein